MDNSGLSSSDNIRDDHIGVITNGKSPIPIKSPKYGTSPGCRQPDPDQEVLERVGLVDLVFSYDKDRNSTGDGVNSFHDKLCEFVYYQPLTSHKAPDIPEAVKVCSPRGRKMFKEALETPFMEAYYTVSPQIDNQPEFCCGTMSLVVALNSLDIDPARATWNEEWRWNHLGSLACCTAILQNPNIDLEQFGCLAVCNDMRAFTKIVTDDWTLNDFRSWIKMAVSRSDIVMVVNHGRREMNQMGSGHFLPMTGYHEASDMILSYDIAKHKYVPQWLPLHMMFNAVKAGDDRSGLNRGFCLLMRPDYESSERIFGPSIVFRIDDIPGNSDPRLKIFMEKWNSVLNEKTHKSLSRQEVLKSTIIQLISDDTFSSDDKVKPSLFPLLELTLRHFKNHSSACDDSGESARSSIIARCRIPQCPAKCPNTLFVHQVESLDIFRVVCEVTMSFSDEERGNILDLVVPQLDGIDAAVRFANQTSQSLSSMLRTVAYLNDSNTKPGKLSGEINNGRKKEAQLMDRCPGYIQLSPEHVITFLLISWPYYVHEPEKMFSRDDFTPILVEYKLPYFSRSGDEKHNKEQTLKNEKRKENHSADITSDTEICSDTIVREYLDKLVREDLRKSHNYRILHEQIRSIKRKFMIVLDYHNISY